MENLFIIKKNIVMECLKNPKRFLFVRYNGSHRYKPAHLSKFMATSTNFVVDYKCVLCGALKVRHFVEWDELLSYGFKNEQIQLVYNGSELTVS